MNRKQLTALVDQAIQGITSEEDMAEAMKSIPKTFYEKACHIFIRGNEKVRLGK